MVLCIIWQTRARSVQISSRFSRSVWPGREVTGAEVSSGRKVMQSDVSFSANVTLQQGRFEHSNKRIINNKSTFSLDVWCKHTGHWVCVTVSASVLIPHTHAAEVGRLRWTASVCYWYRAASPRTLNHLLTKGTDSDSKVCQCYPKASSTVQYLQSFFSRNCIFKCFFCMIVCVCVSVYGCVYMCVRMCRFPCTECLAVD